MPKSCPVKAQVTQRMHLMQHHTFALIFKNGDHLGVHYVGVLSTGTQFDTSVGHKPYEFDLGKGQVH